MTSSALRMVATPSRQSMLGGVVEEITPDPEDPPTEFHLASPSARIVPIWSANRLVTCVGSDGG